MNVGLDGETVGYSGTGVFYQSGGTHAISGGSLCLGYNTGSSGSYTLTSSGYVSSPNECVGYSGVGTFIQTGGVNTISGTNLYVGYNGSGTYGLSGTGVLTTNMLYLGYASGSGSIGMAGGSLAVSNSVYVGYSGSGTFTQSDGTVTFGGNSNGGLCLGFNSGSSGTCNLSGGQLIGGPYSNFEYVGYSGTGSFTQTGGNNTTNLGYLYLGFNSGSSGTYSLAGRDAVIVRVRRLLGHGKLYAVRRDHHCNRSGAYLGYNTGSSGSYSLAGPVCSTVT